uniref:ureidoglycolate dehydrogenase n=1 Tax=Histophilus somni TaxID=731 RepID=UPI00201F822C
MRITRDELKGLITNKLHKAGLDKKDAELTAECLVWSEERGYHSHGAVRVEYYSERIAKGGINNKPNFEWKETGPASAIFEADNGSGFVASVESTKKAIEMAKKSGIAVVGVRNVSHTGSIGYYTEMAAKEGLVALGMWQSDPRVIPYGGAEPYYGTNPIAFSAPSKDGRIVVFDMATTVQAWGKILDKKAKGEKIPDTWAVDENGDPVTDPNKVNSLLQIAGPKEYG